jgi:hypothetical protein
MDSGGVSALARYQWPVLIRSARWLVVAVVAVVAVVVVDSIGIVAAEAALVILK